MGAMEEVRSGRPRDPRLDDGILAAAQQLLIERGYAGTTVETVARAAGTGKAAVYRRWPSKTDLVVAAVRALQFDAPPADTGSLRGDLIECGMHFARADDRATRVLASVLSEIPDNAELREVAYRGIGGPPVEALTAVMRRWVDRGVVSPSVPLDLLAGIIPTAAFGSVTLRRRVLDEETVVDLVDHVLLPALTR